MHNLVFVIRQLRKTPGFTILAIAVLALGIGMSTVIFSMADELFFRGLPFADAERLVRIYGETSDRKITQAPFSIPRFRHYRDGQNAFSAIAADASAGFTLSGMGDAIPLNGSQVTANYFELLGVRPVLGRLFRPEEEQNANVVLVSEAFWKERMGRDPLVLGRGITLNGVLMTIVGVLPEMPASWFGANWDIWMAKPFEFNGFSREQLMRGVSYLRVIARLKEGVSLEQARAAMVSLQQAYRTQHPDAADRSWLPRVVSAAEDVIENFRPTFAILLVAVGVLFTIAVTNIAGLLLVRFSARRHETALRLALGGTRGAIMRLFVMESLLVSAIACGVGVLLAVCMTSALSQLLVDSAILQSAAKVSPVAVLFALTLSLFSALLVGVYPARHSLRPDVLGDLKETSRGSRGSARQHRVRALLIASQVALSVMLLAGASLLVVSFGRLSQQDPGCRLDGVWVASIGLPQADYPDQSARTRFAERFQAELGNLPGVESEAFGDALPLTGNQARSPYARAEDAAIAVPQRPFALLRTVMPGYFRSLGVPVLAGREFSERDREGGPSVVIISRAAAKSLFAGEENPIGHSLLIGTANGLGEPCEIVGVVGDVRTVQLAREDGVEFYRPWSQRNVPFLFLGVRTSLPPREAGNLVRAALNKVDPTLAIVRPTTMASVAAESLVQQRVSVVLIMIFAASALTLSTMGTYGAVAHFVAQRTSEIGIRRALGAQARDIMILVVGRGMRPVVLGVILGLACACALARLIAQQLYQVSDKNLSLMAGPAVGVAVVALVACLIPALRALRVSALVALREL